MFKNLLFGAILIYAWALAMFVNPTGLGEGGGSDLVLYALTVAPAVIFILACAPDFVRPRYDKSSLVLLLLLIVVSVFSIARDDLSTAISVGSLCAMLAAVQHSQAYASLKLINRLFLISILVSELMFVSGVGIYGVFPGQALNDNVPWRVSLFTYNVTSSWLFSLIVIGLNYFHNHSRHRRVLMIALGLYFLVMSASRTGFIVFALCVLFLACTRFVTFRLRAFYRLFIPLAMIAFVVLLNTEQILILLTGVDNPLLNAVLFKSTETVGSVEQVSASIVRTMIWASHYQLFMENPLLGHGTFTFLDTAPELARLSLNGSEAFLTAMFARIGLLAVLFVYAVYLFAIDDARRCDRLGYCLMVLFCITMLAYGSYIVPYDFIFLALFGARNFSRVQAAPANTEGAAPREPAGIVYGTAALSSAREG